MRKMYITHCNKIVENTIITHNADKFVFGDMVNFPIEGDGSIGFVDIAIAK